MAKIGQMMLQKGKYAGKQVLPEKFLEEASAPFFRWDIPSWSNPVEARHFAIGYGYQMWINTDAFFASGHMGQFIYVLPEYDAVIAMTSDYENDEVAASDLVWKYLVPVLQREKLEYTEIQGSKGALRGWILRPDVKGKVPVVILCHVLT